MASAVSGLFFLYLNGSFAPIFGESLEVDAAVAVTYSTDGVDLIINRTLVYTTLTGTLVLFYVGGVVSLQYVLRAFTGGNSQLAVMASTLAIAALFNPFRRRVQSFVDLSFYLNKYDARNTLEAFLATLHDEVELDHLAEELVTVVERSVQLALARGCARWLRYRERKGEARCEIILG